MGKELRQALGDRQEIRLLSTLPPKAPPTRWQVEPAPGRRLATLLSVLSGEAAGGPTVWLSAQSMVLAAPGDPFEGPAAALRLSPGVRLGLQAALAVDPGAPEYAALAAKAMALLASDFHEAADAQIEGAALTGWRPLPYNHPERGGIVDCRRLTARPWYCATAPGAGAWDERFREAVRSGEIERAAVEADVVEGLLRPSALFQLDNDLLPAGDLPRTVLDIDTATRFAEVRLSDDRLHKIATVRYALPRKRNAPERPRELPSGESFRARRGIRTDGELVLWALDVGRFAILHPWKFAGIARTKVRALAQGRKTPQGKKNKKAKKKKDPAQLQERRGLKQNDQALKQERLAGKQAGAAQKRARRNGTKPSASPGDPASRGLGQRAQEAARLAVGHPRQFAGIVLRKAQAALGRRG
ncbi:MAG: hypothetical protein WD100_03345 [Tistlia sp.]|uniref:hypothetical protein n=1 Tax=Tistlia sp. TaxID=3057121 RepID=UPI0034A59F8D